MNQEEKYESFPIKVTFENGDQKIFEGKPQLGCTNNSYQPELVCLVYKLDGESYMKVKIKGKVYLQNTNKKTSKKTFENLHISKEE